MRDNVSGDYNTAFGQASLQNNTASNNVAFGHNAAIANTSGTRNIAIGYKAYDAADQEDDNLAIGYDALGGAVAGGLHAAISRSRVGRTPSADSCRGQSRAVSQVAAGARNLARGGAASGTAWESGEDWGVQQ